MRNLLHRWRIVRSMDEGRPLPAATARRLEEDPLLASYRDRMRALERRLVREGKSLPVPESMRPESSLAESSLAESRWSHSAVDSRPRRSGAPSRAREREPGAGPRWALPLVAAACCALFWGGWSLWRPSDGSPAGPTHPVLVGHDTHAELDAGRAGEARAPWSPIERFATKATLLSVAGVTRAPNDLLGVDRLRAEFRNVAADATSVARSLAERVSLPGRRLAQAN